MPELQLPLLEDVIAKIKLMEPLTFQEELVYLIGVRRLSKEEAALILEEEMLNASKAISEDPCLNLTVGA